MFRNNILCHCRNVIYIYYLSAFPSYADIFYVIGQIFYFVAFIYLYNKKEKLRLSIKDKEMVIFSTVLTLSILSYLIYNFILPSISESSNLEIFLNFFYPVSSAILFIFIFLYQINSKEKKGVVFYLVLEGFLSYIADTLFVYNDWTGNYGIIGIISDILYLLGYLSLLLGLVLFYNMIQRNMNKNNIN